MISAGLIFESCVHDASFAVSSGGLPVTATWFSGTYVVKGCCIIIKNEI